jgi:signal transduction histidine kinase
VHGAPLFLPASARWVPCHTVLAAAVLAMAACGESAEDKARAQGEALGQALVKLSQATSVSQLTSALGDVNTARSDISQDVSDEIGQQLTSLSSQLGQVGDDARKALTASSSADRQSAEQAAKESLQKLGQSARQTKETATGVRQAFWDGFNEGVTGS